MQKAGNIPKTGGVYVLLHPANKLAYVGKCANLRHRAAVWEYNFRQRDKDPAHQMPVKGFPPLPSSEWEYGGFPNLEIPTLRKALVEEGYTFINEETRVRDVLEYKGKTATLAEHARDANIPYTKAYYRLKKGQPLEQVFATGE